MPAPYYGKYRGKVEQNIDPLNKGRIQVSVRDVLKSGKMSWAMPCVPYAGPGLGFFSIPPKGASVWVEFEGGDPEWPIWTGCFWDDGQFPPVMPALPSMRAFKTDSVDLQIVEVPGVGSLTLKVGPPALLIPAEVKMSASGIKLTFAKSTVEVSPEGVKLNGANLVVLP
ncbi:MAG: phage baseplate assembly protein V [Actinomycetota bacterium]